METRPERPFVKRTEEDLRWRSILALGWVNLFMDMSSELNAIGLISRGPLELLGCTEKKRRTEGCQHHDVGNYCFGPETE